MSAATERLELSPGRPPWLEMLAPLISVEALRAGVGGGEGQHDRVRGPDLWIPFGMIDDPAAQAQYGAVLDLAESGGLIVSGAGGSGKSTALRTIAISAAMDDSERGGGRLTIFAIDFTSRGLGALSRLPQCAAVATGDDIEAVTRIIRLLHGELERRRRAMAGVVARAQPQSAEPTVLLLIDGMDAATQAMELGPGAGGLAQHHAELMRLLSEGRQVGIHPIISTTRQSAIRAGVSSAIAARLILRQTDSQGYLDCGIGAADAKELDLKPGQGFFDGTKLIQVATLTGPRSEDGSAGPPAATELGLERLGEAAEGLTGWVDPRLETAALPARLGLLSSQGLDDDTMRPIIGRADLTSAPFALDLRYDNVSIVGDPRSGRSTALATIGRQAAATGVEVLALGRPGSPLEQVVEPTRSCFEDGEPRQRFLEASLEELLDRQTARQTGDQSQRTPRPATTPTALLLVDDYDLLPEHDRSLVAVIEQLLGTVRYVAAGTVPRGFSSNPISQLIRSCRSQVYLRPTDNRTAQEILGVPVPWHPGLAMVEGRGIVVVDRVATIVQFSDASSPDR